VTEARDAAHDAEAPLTPLLLSEPTLSERLIEADDRFVILACDGVWDVLSDQQACDSVKAALASGHDGGGTAADAAKKLANEAYAKGSLDNISVVVAVLRPYLV